MINKVIITYIDSKSVREVPQDNEQAIEAIKALANAADVKMVYKQFEEPAQDRKDIAITLTQPFDYDANFLKFRNITWRCASVAFEKDRQLGYQLPVHYSVHVSSDGKKFWQIHYEAEYLAKGDYYWQKVKKFIDAVLTQQQDIPADYLADDVFAKYNIEIATKFLQANYQLVNADHVAVDKKMTIQFYVLNGHREKFDLLIIVLDADTEKISTIIHHQRKMNYPEL